MPIRSDLPVPNSLPRPTITIPDTTVASGQGNCPNSGKKAAVKHKAVAKPKPVVKEEEILVEIAPVEVAEVANGNGKEKYFQAIGRRKESIARVRLYTKKSTDTVEGEKALVVVNGKDYRSYFSDVNLWSIVESPLRKL